MTDAVELAALVQELVEAGEDFDPDLEDALLTRGDAAIAPLLAVVNDDALHDQDAVGDGWAPAHAATLLGRMQAVVAIPSMLRVLGETDFMDVVHDRIVQALLRVGAPVVEPALAAYAASTDRGFRASVAGVLAGAGVKDDRILLALLEMLAEAPTSGAVHLAEYGDERALPHLARAFDAFEIDGDSAIANHDLIELEAAIVDLGGCLTPAQTEKKRDARAVSDRWRAQMEAAMRARMEPVARAEPARREVRPGRNER
jgi:hypothetical protein